MRHARSQWCGNQQLACCGQISRHCEFKVSPGKRKAETKPAVVIKRKDPSRSSAGNREGGAAMSTVSFDIELTVDAAEVYGAVCDACTAQIPEGLPVPVQVVAALSVVKK